MGLKYTKRAMTSYEVHRFFHGLEISFFPDTKYNRENAIWTRDLYVPNVALYQAEPHSDNYG